jgi:hypothetical protein
MSLTVLDPHLLPSIQYEMEHHLSLFGRDEVMAWLHTQKRAWAVDIPFRSTVATAIESIVKRAETMACKIEREQVCVFRAEGCCCSRTDRRQAIRRIRDKPLSYKRLQT